MGSRGRRKRKVQDRQVKGLVRKNKKSSHIPFPNKVSKVASNVKVTLEFRDQRDGECFIGCFFFLSRPLDFRFSVEKKRKIVRKYREKVNVKKARVEKV